MVWPHPLDVIQYARSSYYYDVYVANSVDPGEMLHYAAFHLGLQCLPRPPVYKGFQDRPTKESFLALIQANYSNNILKKPSKLDHS